MKVYKGSPLRIYTKYIRIHHTKHKEDADYYYDLIDEIHKDENLYFKYINPDRLLTDDELSEFIQSINFKFEDNCFTKVYIIDEIKKEINKTLQTHDSNLTLEDCTHISNVVLEKFFESTYNTAVTEIYIDELIKIIENKHEYTLKHIEQFEIRRAIDVINTNLEFYSKRLERRPY